MSAKVIYRPPAFVQVDVDGLWAVRRCYAVPEEDTFQRDPVWSEGVPSLRRMFENTGFRASFFVVGVDMNEESKRREVGRLADAGHEIANHSFEHRIGMTRLACGGIRRDLKRTHRALCAVAPPPVGFRAPGYDVDARVVRHVRRMGYWYDASMLLTRLGPAMRVADAWLARRWQPGKRQFGRVAHGGAPRGPYFPDPRCLWRRSRGARTFMELPVGTLGPLDMPLTGSAIFALGPREVIRRLEKALPMQRPVLLLLHGIDLVDCTKPIVFGNRRPSLGGFDLSHDDKAAAIRPVLEWLAANYTIVRARDYVAERTQRTEFLP